MPPEPAAIPPQRPSPAVVRALGQGSGWMLFLAVTGLVTNGLGVISMLTSVGQLGELPAAAGKVARWITLFSMLLGMAPMVCAVLLLRVALVVRRLDARSPHAEVESALERLATYWHWSAITLLLSVVVGVVFLFVVAAAVAVAGR